MIEHAVVYIQSVIADYGVAGVFIATVIEELVAPIPSALVPLAAGFFLLPADAPLGLVAVEAIFLVAIPVALGMVVGSSILYAIGYWGGKPVIERTRKFTGISWREIERIEAKFTKGKRDEVTLFVLRMIPIVPGVALSGFCGAVRYPFRRFIVITLLGSGLRALLLGLAGWQAGEFYIRYIDTIDRFESDILIGGVLALAIAGIAYYLLKRR